MTSSRQPHSPQKARSKPATKRSRQIQTVNPSDSKRPYVLRISRLTVDKLGVKMYDKVSAVVAELVANGYDADAELVTVRLPLNTLLATKREDGKILDAGFIIEVEDDGHGMTPDEAIDFYLQVGRERRTHIEQGSLSRNKRRPVMGRKGIGKLAPFGICRRIEVLSAGGEETKKGFLVTHFYMDRDDILSDTDKPIRLDPGPEDRTYRPGSGTTIRLSGFLPKRVPDGETFHRQMAARFVFARPDFHIYIQDTRETQNKKPAKVKSISVPTVQGTRINLSTRPVITDDGEKLAVTGWLGLAKNPYKNEETAGVRIYARNKIVGTTRDFEQPAGFTGEFTIRSYLVGEVHADWLDLDEGEDLIRSDRQGILWDSDYGRAFRKWGAELIKEIGAVSREPRRKRARDIFLEKSSFTDLAKAKYADQEVVDVAVELASQIGSFAAEDELEDDIYISGLTDMILSVAPHKALIQAFQEFSRLANAGELSVERLLDLFGKARVAEMASYSQIAAERVRVLKELENTAFSQAAESELQRLITEAPWLIEPTWTVITKNQALKTFKAGFEHFWKERTGQSVTLAIEFEEKRPDFTLISLGHMLHVVEIKAPGHHFDDTDMERLINYVDAFEAFFEQKKKTLMSEFPLGWRIDLVADGESLAVSTNKRTFEGLVEKGFIERNSWYDFLSNAKKAHETFLEVNALYVKKKSTLEKNE